MNMTTSLASNHNLHLGECGELFQQAHPHASRLELENNSTKSHAPAENSVHEAVEQDTVSIKTLVNAATKDCTRSHEILSQPQANPDRLRYPRAPRRPTRAQKTDPITRKRRMKLMWQSLSLEWRQLGQEQCHAKNPSSSNDNGLGKSTNTGKFRCFRCLYAFHARRHECSTKSVVFLASTAPSHFKVWYPPQLDCATTEMKRQHARDMITSLWKYLIL